MVVGPYSVRRAVGSGELPLVHDTMRYDGAVRSGWIKWKGRPGKTDELHPPHLLPFPPSSVGHRAAAHINQRYTSSPSALSLMALRVHARILRTDRRDWETGCRAVEFGH